MFYFFSKTITYFLTPAGWLVIALLVAFFTKNSLWRRRLVGIAFLVLWCCGNTFLINELARWWEYPIQADPAATADSSRRVAVLLTGGMINGMTEIPGQSPSKRTNKRFLLGPEADRAGQVLYLYKTGAVQKILISGGAGDLPFQTKHVNDEGHMTAQFLVLAGVKPADIVLENKSRNTRENAIFSAPLLHQRFHTNHCVLVTSAWHMRRAIGCFEKAHVAVTPFPSNFMSGKRSFAPGTWLLPNEEALVDAYHLIREMIGYATYAVVGYV